MSHQPIDQIQQELSRLEKLRQQVLTDMEALRAQEANLRNYESRLRETQPPMAFPGAATRAPMAVPGSPHDLAAEWEKFQRSRALLEAERRTLVDDRLVLREERDELKRREAALAAREAQFTAQQHAETAKKFPPPKPSLTQAPFAAAKKILRRAS